jgi:hypothetical protein
MRGLSPVVVRCLEYLVLGGLCLGEDPRTGKSSPVISLFFTQLVRLLLASDPSAASPRVAYSVQHVNCGDSSVKHYGIRVWSLPGAFFGLPHPGYVTATWVLGAIDNLIERPKDVFSSHITEPLVKLDALSKLECPGEIVVGKAPAFRQHGKEFR